ncbi:YybH family protein [Acinetobacter seifertii]|uniref:YybH family protein n=1 Tax=Acinetobacter seifertii TaxID=1530123 RepID=UPI001C0CBFA9|nr:SgcJ/EcaC family oxidoreductase [Acinetobacter seifertii]
MNQKITNPEDIPLAFQIAWNNHDMKAFAALFHQDATFVNRFSHYVKGVDEIVALHQPIHDTIYSDSTLENELIDITPMSDDICISHFWSRLTAGVAHPKGPHKIDTLILTVLIKKNNSWYIQALENVTLTNPRTGEIVLRNI